MASVPTESLRYWTPSRTAGATLIFAGVAAVFASLFYLQAAVFCLVIAIILATALGRPIGLLERRGLPRGAAVVLVFLLLVVILITVLAIGIPLIAHQAIDLRDTLSRSYDQARQRLSQSPIGIVRQLANQLSPKMPLLPVSGELAPSEFAPPALRYLGDVLPSVLFFFAMLMLAFYWSLQEDRTLRALLLLVPVRRREAARELVEAIRAKVGDFIFGQITVCGVIGLLTFVAYEVIRLPHALPLALLTGVMEAVPVFGLLASAIPAALVALSISGGKFFALVVAIAVIHLSDNFFISPKIMGRSVGLHPIVTLLALVGFGELFGLPGAILAILLASIAQLLLDRFWLSREAQTAAPIEGRDHISLLRHEAQEVLQDARLSIRRKEGAPSTHDEHFEEKIETLATELERILSVEYVRRGGTHGEIEARE